MINDSKVLFKDMDWSVSVVIDSHSLTNQESITPSNINFHTYISIDIRLNNSRTAVKKFKG